MVRVQFHRPLNLRHCLLVAPQQMKQVCIIGPSLSLVGVELDSPPEGGLSRGPVPLLQLAYSQRGMDIRQIVVQRQRFQKSRHRVLPGAWNASLPTIGPHRGNSRVGESIVLILLARQLELLHGGVSVSQAPEMLSLEIGIVTG